VFRGAGNATGWARQAGARGWARQAGGAAFATTSAQMAETFLLTGVSARRLRQEFTGKINRAIMHGHFWSPSYFAGSCGAAPLAAVKEYIENQRRPDLLQVLQAVVGGGDAAQLLLGVGQHQAGAVHAGHGVRVCTISCSASSTRISPNRNFPSSPRASCTSWRETFMSSLPPLKSLVRD
jgi:Transposase IS200 like